MADYEDLKAAIEVIAPLLAGAGGLGQRIAALEHDLVGKDRDAVAAVVEAHGISPGAMSASLLVRESLGKLSDLIHAVGIVLALPHILEPGEVLKTPSLAAGNDPARLYDVETNQRAAEFKLARWTVGGNGGRGKDLFKNLVLLTQAQPSLRAEIYVRGSRPAHFLRGNASARNQLKRSAAVLAIFDAQVDDPLITVSQYVTEHAPHVRVLDLEQVVPGGYVT